MALAPSPEVAYSATMAGSAPSLAASAALAAEASSGAGHRLGPPSPEGFGGLIPP